MEVFFNNILYVGKVPDETSQNNNIKVSLKLLPKLFVEEICMYHIIWVDVM